jgi:hypothetical protein
MGHGAQILLLPCRSVRFPLVFTAAHKEDRLLKVYAMSGKYNIIGSLITSESLGSVCFSMCKSRNRADLVQARCSKGTCSITHSTPTASNKIDTHTTIQESSSTNLRIPGTLPPYWQASPDQVPVNEHGQRLDYSIKLPEYSNRQAYQERYSIGTKPCKWHRLLKRCQLGDECTYDHAELRPGFLPILRSAVRRVPCELGCLHVDVPIASLIMSVRVGSARNKT